MLAQKSATGLRPEVRARLGRRAAVAMSVASLLALAAAFLAAKIVSTHLDRDPVELMALHASQSSPADIGPALDSAHATPKPVTRGASEEIRSVPVAPALVSPQIDQVSPPQNPTKPLIVTRAMLKREPVPMFDGRRIRRARTVEMVVTGYSPDARSCGASADGITASGYSVWTNGMYMVAADTRLLPFGSVVSIPGYNGGEPVPVLDRGGAIKGRRLDLLYPTHEAARAWGRKTLTITVWEYAD